MGSVGTVIPWGVAGPTCSWQDFLGGWRLLGSEAPHFCCFLFGLVVLLLKGTADIPNPAVRTFLNS